MSIGIRQKVRRDRRAIHQRRTGGAGGNGVAGGIHPLAEVAAGKYFVAAGDGAGLGRGGEVDLGDAECSLC